jgi:hypothetical protein
MLEKLGRYQSGLVFLAVAGGFIAILLADLRSTNKVECSLCIEFEGRTQCASGQGADPAAAQQSAHTVACAPLASGPNQAFRCSSAPPQQLACRNI